jgi:hypothetical protein
MSQEKAMRLPQQDDHVLVRSRARRVTIHIIRAAVTMSRAADNVSPTTVTRCVGDLTSSNTATDSISGEEYENANANFFSLRRIDAHVGSDPKSRLHTAANAARCVDR